MKTRKEIAHQESTRDPIFLFQGVHYIITGILDGWVTDGEAYWKSDSHDPEFDFNEDEYPSNKELESMTHGDYDIPYALKTWNTDLIFFTREEAELWGKAHSYRYTSGWRVYCICAEGFLCGVLKELDNLKADKCVSS